eukprot:2846834-Prymnesium_polylepis.1
MYGTDIGTLAVQTADGTSVWTKSSNQGNAWYSASVMLNSATFRFHYVSGTSYRADAAVDSIQVSCQEASPLPPPSL